MTATDIRICRRCKCNLQWATTRRCPDCDMPFDPDDPETYLDHIPTPGGRGRLGNRLVILAGMFMVLFSAITLHKLVTDTHRARPTDAAIVVVAAIIGAALLRIHWRRTRYRGR